MDCVCGHAEHDGFCHCGCSLYVPDNDEREPEATGGRRVDPYEGAYGQEKRYSL